MNCPILAAGWEFAGVGEPVGLMIPPTFHMMVTFLTSILSESLLRRINHVGIHDAVHLPPVLWLLPSSLSSESNACSSNGRACNAGDVLISMCIDGYRPEFP